MNNLNIQLIHTLLRSNAESAEALLKLVQTTVPMTAPQAELVRQRLDQATHAKMVIEGESSIKQKLQTLLNVDIGFTLNVDSPSLFHEEKEEQLTGPLGV